MKIKFTGIILWRICWLYLLAANVSAQSTDLQQTVTPSDDNYKARTNWNIACQQRVNAMKGKPCDIIFIGDSITQNWTEKSSKSWTSVGITVWDKFYANRHALNFGVGADKTQNVLWRMDHMDIQDLHPKVAVILIGINNARDPATNIAAGIKAVVEKTRSMFVGCKIILVSIAPSARETEKMANVDKIIQTFADDQSVFYFDLASKMTPEGKSWKGLGPDRLHFAPAGYEIWATNMEPLLNRLLVNRSSQ